VAFVSGLAFHSQWAHIQLHCYTPSDCLIIRSATCLWSSIYPTKLTCTEMWTQ